MIYRAHREGARLVGRPSEGAAQTSTQSHLHEAAEFPGPIFNGDKWAPHSVSLGGETRLVGGPLGEQR